ncbi:hypothetical protein GCM10010300_46320 [Streptomyces olivaceoviridis]|nr:hypothetical protein GCM10010300_46320 [Streptomyces olivaceoviridis]
MSTRTGHSRPDNIREHRWWTLAELRTTAETVYPLGLADLLTGVLAHGAPLHPVVLAGVERTQLLARGPGRSSDVVTPSSPPRSPNVRTWRRRTALLTESYR